MSWKGASEPNIKYCLGRQVNMVQRVHHNTELWTQSTVNRWNSSEYFPRIHYIAARPRSPKVHEQNERTRTTPRTNYLHVDVQ